MTSRVHDQPAATVPFLWIVTVPLLILLGLTASYDLETNEPYQLLRLELALAAVLIVAATATGRCARGRRPMTRVASILLLVGCSLSAALGSSPGVLARDLIENAMITVVIAAMTAVLAGMTLDRSAGRFVFWCVALAWSIAAAWHAAGPPVLARFIVQH